MALLTTPELLRMFTSHVAASTKVDVAVAWLGPSRALDMLASKTADGTLQTRVAVSLYGNATSPIARRSLQGAKAQLRVGDHPTGVFHPKFYLFRGPHRNVCWIGSANLTLGGFADNFELIQEFIDDGVALQWFENVWASLPSDSNDSIDFYEKNWERPPPKARVRDEPSAPWSGDRSELLESATTWNEYVDALRNCDAYWRSESSEKYSTYFSVLADEWSWVDTISHGSNIARRGSWDDLSKEEKRILLGIQTIDAPGAWGLLGNMSVAGTAVGAFYTDRSIRRKIRAALQLVIDTNNRDEFRRAAAQTISNITQLQGFGPAVATRLIALARPDMGMSVNRGSAPTLSQLTGLPEAAGILGNAENYPRLLQWIYAQPWYNVAEPEGAFEQIIWSMRAALIDSFVFKPVKPSS
jgi:HKD family nuclease